MLHLVSLVVCVSVLVAHCQLHPATDHKEEIEKDFLVPNIPKPLEASEYGTSRFVFIWANRIHQENQTAPHLRNDDPSRPEPATILTPTEFHMLNLVPQDAPNPLYSSRYTELTDDFLLDHMSTDFVDPADNRMATPEGLTIKTRTGKDLLFKKDPKTNHLTVNGIPIESTHPIAGSPRMTLFGIDGFLFDNRQKVDEAFQILSKDAATSPHHPLIRPKPPTSPDGDGDASRQ